MAKDAPKPEINSVDSYVSIALGLAVVLLVGAVIYNFFVKKTPSGGQTANPAASVTKENEVPAGLPAEHVVKEGDTLWSIAEKFYSSGYNWVDIKKANPNINPDVIEPGTKLIIPAAKPIVPGQAIISSSTSETPKQTSYTVKQGDFLWEIAQGMYGNPYKWSDIARANKLENPNIIHTGNVLTLP